MGRESKRMLKCAELKSLESTTVTSKIMSYLGKSRNYFFFFPQMKHNTELKFHKYALTSVKYRAVCWVPLGRASRELSDICQLTGAQSEVGARHQLSCFAWGLSCSQDMGLSVLTLVKPQANQDDQTISSPNSATLTPCVCWVVITLDI